MKATIVTSHRKATDSVRGVVKFSDGKEWYYDMRAGMVMFEGERETTFGSVRIRIRRSAKYDKRVDAFRAALTEYESNR